MKELKELISKMDGPSARAAATALLDVVDGTKDGQFSSQEVAARMESEALRAAVRIQKNPAKAIAVTIAAVAIAFAAGGFLVWLLRPICAG